MCGLVGSFSYGKQPADRHQLLAMRDRMISRGPDGAGLWISPDGRAGLAHRRLSVIEVSQDGHQPMIDPETGNTIVFNGEIYNFRSLRRELEAKGHRFRTGSDTEVLLALFRAHDVDFLPRLRGMYAFAIYQPARQRLFLARDPFGIKPLYVAEAREGLHFASQVKPLAAELNLREPDPAGHAGFLLWGHVPEPFTLHRGIRALPAGGGLVVEHDGAQRAFSHFDMAARVCELEPLRVSAEGDRDAILAEALADAARHHMVADVPVGVFLSSGIDSCTLAALARHVSPAALHTITLGFREYEGRAEDEVPLAEAAARRLGATHTTRRISGDDFNDALDHLLDAMDQPSIDGVNTYFVAKTAHEAGLKVALSGIGGDELLAGYDAFRTMPALVRRAALPARIPGAGKTFRALVSPLVSRFTSPKYAGLFEYGGSLGGAYLLRHALFMPWEIAGLLGPEMAREGLRTLETGRALARSLPGTGDTDIEIGALTSQWYMRNQLLRDADWAGMSHSLEIRPVFADVPLWEMVTRLRLAGVRVHKQDMIRAAAKIPAFAALPEAVFNRKKTGFSIPVRDWVRSSPACAGAAEDRGLRGWARLLHARAGFGSLAP